MRFSIQNFACFVPLIKNEVVSVFFFFHPIQVCFQTQSNFFQSEIFVPHEDIDILSDMNHRNESRLAIAMCVLYTHPEVDNHEVVDLIDEALPLRVLTTFGFSFHLSENKAQDDSER